MKKGQRIGYIRVSSEDQNPERQLESVDTDKLFIDKVSGKDMNRPGLQNLLGYIREGDTLVVHSMDRLARNLDDLRSLVYQLTARHITVSFIKEGLHFTGEDSPMSKLLLSVMGAVAEFERAHIRERQKEGIRIAKLKKVYKGRVPKLNAEQIEQLYERFRSHPNKSKLALEFKISHETLYKHFRNFKKDHACILCDDIRTGTLLNASTTEDISLTDHLIKAREFLKPKE